MSETNPTPLPAPAPAVEPRRDAITMLSESSPVRLSLAILLLIGGWTLWDKIDAMRLEQGAEFKELRQTFDARLGLFDAKLEASSEQFVSKELFQSEMNSLRREIATMVSAVTDSRQPAAGAQPTPKNR